MKRIKEEKNVSAWFCGNHPTAVNKAIVDLTYAVSYQMFKEDLFTISKTGGLFSPTYNNEPEVNVAIEAFCMKEEEFKECIKLLHVIKDVVPVEYSEYVERLRKLLTE